MRRRLVMTIMSLTLVVSSVVPVMAYDSEEVHQHKWGEWEVWNEASCAYEGTMARSCDECFEMEYKAIPKTNDHEWDDEWETVKAATISKQGTKQRVCWLCDTVQTASIKKLKPFAKFSKKKVSITKGNKKKLKPTFAKGDKVKKWKSSNKRVAIVNSKGKVTAKGYGTTKITAIMKSGKKATCTVKVVKKKAVKVYWTPSGTVYHYSSDCSTLSRSRVIRSGTIGQSGKGRACKVCGY